MPGLLALALAVLLALGAAFAAPPAPAAPPPPVSRAVIAFLPGSQDTILRALDARSPLVLGLASATLEPYSPGQARLDIGSGSRTSPLAYQPHDPPRLALGPGGRIVGWARAVRRAHSAPTRIVPGLLASSLPGGGAFAGDGPDAAVAAGRDGRVAHVSRGTGRSLVSRVRRLQRRSGLVVVDLPPPPRGARALDALLAARSRSELLLVLRAPPVATDPQLLPIGVAGPGFAPGALTSATTRRAGVVALIDVAPTVLRALGRATPATMRGQAMRSTGRRDAGALRTLAARWSVIEERRLPAFGGLALAWLALAALLTALGRGRGWRAAARVGALALVWLPSVALLVAALEPGLALEITLLAAGPLVLGALTDRLVPWPRAPALPAAVALVAHGIDLARGSGLITGSLLGPNPRFGARFYGVGNELEIVLSLLLLLGLAAAVGPRAPVRRAAALFALGGLGAGTVMAAGRLGADVGSVVTVGTGTVVAILVLLGGGLTLRRLGAVVLVPVLGLAALAALDTITGGEGHFSRTVLHGGLGDLAGTLRGRAELALYGLVDGPLAVLTPLALLALGCAVALRRRLLAPLDPVARAGLLGGLAAAVAGSLANDSGSLLLVIGVVALAAALAYAHSPPSSAFLPRALEGRPSALVAAP